MTDSTNKNLLLSLIVFVVLLFSVLVTSAHGDTAWVLWRYTYTTRAPKEVKATDYERYVIQNDWVILNAFETRAQCLSLLREEFSRKRESMIADDPAGKVNQSPLGDGVTASLWSGRNIKFGQAGTEMHLAQEHHLWCLPAGVDPRTTRINMMQQR
jgi:hypothetical protein